MNLEPDQVNPDGLNTHVGVSVVTIKGSHSRDKTTEC